MGLFMWFDHVEESLARIEQSLTSLHTKADTLMAQVQVNSDDLAALDTALDEATTTLADHIAALSLPEGDLTALQADVEALRALSAPTPAQTGTPTEGETGGQIPVQ